MFSKTSKSTIYHSLTCVRSPYNFPKHFHVKNVLKCEIELQNSIKLTLVNILSKRTRISVLIIPVGPYHNLGLGCMPGGP